MRPRDSRAHAAVAAIHYGLPWDRVGRQFCDLEFRGGRERSFVIKPCWRISANRSIKLAVAAAAMALLAGCAVTMPLRPLATFSQSGRADFACRTGAKCSNGTTDHRVSYRRSQLVGGSKIDDDPPDFIGDQDSTPPIRTQNE